MKPALLLASLAGALALDATALVTTQSVPIGQYPWSAALDSATGRIFIGSVGGSRYSTGTYTVVDPDGRSTTFPDDQTPQHVVVSAALRKVVISNGGFSGSSVTILDADTLAKTRVVTGNAPRRAAIVDARATAYVPGHSYNGDVGPGSITEIDLRTGASRVTEVPGYSTEYIAVIPSLNRAFLAGNGPPGGVALAATGWIQAYDMDTHALAGPAVRIPGRRVHSIFAAPDGSRLYVIAHVDTTELWEDGLSIPSLRSAVFVIDPSTLQTVATYPLPEVTVRRIIPAAEAYGVLTEPTHSFEGTAVLDAATNSLFTQESYNKRLMRIDLATGAIQVQKLEGYTRALALNPVTNTLLVTFADDGYVGTYSRDLERLDTIPLGAPTPRAQSVGDYAVLVNPATGDAYATYPKDNVLVLLKSAREGDATSLVNLTDLWSSQSEPGWGLFLEQQGLTAFGALFSADGSWLVMPQGKRQANGSFTGTLYRTRGPATSLGAYAAPIGVMIFTATADGALLQYSADGVAVSKAVTRLTFRSVPKHCTWDAAPIEGSVAKANFTGLWYGPTLPGWGLTLSHQGDTVFGVLYGYDAQQNPTWSVMTNGAQQGDGRHAGTLYRVEGGHLVATGTMNLDFTTSNVGSMRAVMDGVAQEKSITRQVFSTPATTCSN
ncbi:hypothetical protein BWI17_15010 [Betaproteobacteria bacterium GR16-43]|nr:hypothetical protein BWI17_15010 [Betaproteobacteria bacterium GR16-43]